MEHFINTLKDYWEYGKNNKQICYDKIIVIITRESFFFTSRLQHTKAHLNWFPLPMNKKKELPFKALKIILYILVTSTQLKLFRWEGVLE